MTDRWPGPEASHEGGVFARCGLQELVNDALRFCQPLFLEQRILVTVEPGPSQLQLDCHPAEVVHVLTSLLVNGAEAAMTAPDRWVRLVVTERQDDIVLVVSDSGPGVPSDIQAAIFDPFVSTKAPGPGRGLGLTIARRLVARHGGAIVLVDGPGPTCFEVYLPKCQAVRSA